MMDLYDYVASSAGGALRLRKAEQRYAHQVRVLEARGQCCLTVTCYLDTFAHRHNLRWPRICDRHERQITGSSNGN